MVLALGATQQLVAVGRRSDQSLANLFGQVTWRVATGGSVVSVDSNGLVKRLTAGTAEIEAKAQGKTVLLKITSDVQKLNVLYNNTAKNWPTVNIYLWTGEGASKLEPAGKWPGTPMTAGANKIWSSVVEANQLSNGAINVIFNSGAGGPDNQTGNLIAKESAVYDGSKWTSLLDLSSARVSVIDGVLKNTGNTFTAGTVVAISANQPPAEAIFNGWGGDSAAYIFTDPGKSEAQLVVPDGVESLTVDASIVADSFAEGRKLYAAQCARCHGSDGSGGSNRALNALGDRFTLSSLTAFISATMPADTEGKCEGTGPGDCAYEVARMIRADKWPELKTCSGTDCTLDSRNLRVLTKEEYLNSLGDIFSLSFDASLAASVSEDTTSRNFKTASFLALDYYRTMGYQMAAVKAAEKIIAAKSFFNLAGNCGTDKSCVVAALGKKIFRRPLTSVETSRYANLYMDSDKGKAVIQGLLMSPYFLYRSEMGEQIQATDVYRLTNYEIASLLSYSLWATTPDDALLAAAASANFDIAAQVTRMLDDPRVDRGLRRFTSGWLINIKYGFAAVSPSLGETFNEETIRFAMETIKANKPYKTLLTADYTYANAQLASYYGSSAVARDWQQSMFADGDPRRGSGILGHGSFLASRASSIDYPSPIKRGLFVRDMLMCQELPPPQKAGLSIPRTPEDNNRTAVANHTSDSGCKGCHQYVDGIGFGLESFGSDAKYRTREKLGNGQWKDIDSTGSIKSLNSLETKLDDTSQEIPYTTVPELAALIASSSQGKACYSRQYYRYIVGREETSIDEHIIRTYSADVRADGGMKKMLIDLATNPSFILRRKGEQ